MEAASGGYHEVGMILINKVKCWLYMVCYNTCSNNVSSLSFLQGADVNAAPVPSSRDTALTIATDKGHYKFVELLLRCSACVDVKNKKGNSPLWLAANGGCGVLFVMIGFRCLIVIMYTCTCTSGFC